MKLGFFKVDKKDVAGNQLVIPMADYEIDEYLQRTKEYSYILLFIMFFSFFIVKGGIGVLIGLLMFIFTLLITANRLSTIRVTDNSLLATGMFDPDDLDVYIDEYRKNGLEEEKYILESEEYGGLTIGQYSGIKRSVKKKRKIKKIKIKKEGYIIWF